MAVRLSALPPTPPDAHVHCLNFKLPYDLATDADLWKLTRQILGQDYVSAVKKEYGGRRNFQSFYTIRNIENDVLLTIYTHGTGIDKNKTAVCFNGLSFETWSALNPLPPIQIDKLAQFVFDQHGWFTRIDLAKNDYRRVTDWQDAVTASHKTAYRDRLVLRLCRTRPPLYMSSNSESIYYGSNKSRTQILAYVKHDAELTKFPWIRFEMILRGRHQCDDAVRKILAGTDIDTLTSGVLAYHLDFKIQSSTTKAFRPSCKWWTDFVGTEKIKLITAAEKPGSTDQPEEDADDDFTGIEF